MNVINETISIIEDSRASKLGKKCAKEIFEIAILPALLNNSELFPIQDKMVQLAWDDETQILERVIEGSKILPPSSSILRNKLYANEIQGL